MKTLNTLLILFIAPLFINAQTQLDNPGFENWTTIPFLVPDNWIEANTRPVYKSQDACEGSFSVLLTDSIYGSNLGMNNLGQTKQFNIGECPIGISFCYKYKSTPNDVASFYSALVYGNTETSTATKYFNSDVNVWTQETLWFADYTELVDNYYTVNVTLEVHNFYHTSTDYSKLQIDDINLIYGTTGINENESSDNISIYPNPNNGQFKLIIKNKDKVASIEITNTLGQTVYDMKNSVPQAENEIDLSSFQKGIYFLKIYNGEKIHTERIIVH